MQDHLLLNRALAQHLQSLKVGLPIRFVHKTYATMTDFAHVISRFLTFNPHREKRIVSAR